MRAQCIYRSIGKSMQRVTAVKRVFSWVSRNQIQYLRPSGHLPTTYNCFSQRSFSIASRVMAYQAVERGRLNTTDYRVFITDGEGKPLSPFHDIPLYSDPENKVCNMVVEIPRWSNHKMEIATGEELNPIKQDVKKGKIRFVKNCFPHHGYIWNYGALPQTWEDVDHEEPTTGTKGDNDPLDVCEIGQKVHKRGSIIQVKILGVMCLVDEGETDWKVICIDVTDVLASSLNDIGDVEKHMPGFIKATREWFTIYKIPDGKPANKFAYDGQAKDREFALKVIDETHEQWQCLVGAGEAKREGLCCKNVNVSGSPFKIEHCDAKASVEKSLAVGAPDSLPDDVDKWHYIPPSSL